MRQNFSWCWYTSSIKRRQHRDVLGKLILLRHTIYIYSAGNEYHQTPSPKCWRDDFITRCCLSYFFRAVPLPLSKADLRTLMCRVFLSENNSNSSAIWSIKSCCTWCHAAGAAEAGAATRVYQQNHTLSGKTRRSCEIWFIFPWAGTHFLPNDTRRHHNAPTHDSIAISRWHISYPL
jgi:hypothetical protein